MNRRAESISHTHQVKAEITSIKKELSFSIFAPSPMSALAELHNLIQNTHHYNPQDYTVTFLKRDGMAPYEIAGNMTNPDVRHRKRSEGPMLKTGEMFPVEELKGQPSDTPIFSLPVAAPAASTVSP